jgi:anti-sigma regulatory factor (Ser/Thr protein kinase)
LSESLSISFSSHPKFLSIVRNIVAQIGELVGFSPSEANRLRLAVDEACTNIMKYSYEGDTKGKIDLTFNLLSDRLEIVLSDYGKKLDPSTMKPRDLNDLKPGGLGLHLISTVMDRVEYSLPTEKGNKTLLVKYIDRESKGHGNKKQDI